MSYRNHPHTHDDEDFRNVNSKQKQKNDLLARIITTILTTFYLKKKPITISKHLTMKRTLPQIESSNKKGKYFQSLFHMLHSCHLNSYQVLRLCSHLRSQEVTHAQSFKNKYYGHSYQDLNSHNTYLPKKMLNLSLNGLTRSKNLNQIKLNSNFPITNFLTNKQSYFKVPLSC